MGAYTSKFQFYKPDPSEFVDVEVQLNKNLDIADSAVRRCFEYEYTNLAVPVVVGAFNRSKFYKPYSNSFMAWSSTTGFFQDAAAYVSPWFNATEYMVLENFSPHADFPPAYRVIKKAGGTTAEVEWSGAITGVSLDPMDLNANIQWMTAGPAEIRPVISKYFQVWAGNTATNYSIARLFISNGGGGEFKRYGVDPSATPSTENRVELTGITYNIEVTGT